MFDANRDQLRHLFFQAWQKKQKQAPLTALEQQIVSVIEQHPEYHRVIEQPERHLQEDYSTDNNPFLHLSLHLGLQEQLSTNRPAGINVIYEKLVHKVNDPHLAQHHMMDVMATLLWDAQQQGRLPDETTYLEKLNTIITAHG